MFWLTIGVYVLYAVEFNEVINLLEFFIRLIFVLSLHKDLESLLLIIHFDALARLNQVKYLYHADLLRYGDVSLIVICKANNDLGSLGQVRIDAFWVFLEFSYLDVPDRVEGKQRKDNKMRQQGKINGFAQFLFWGDVVF